VVYSLSFLSPNDLDVSSLEYRYGCFLWEEMMAYALNFTFPWRASLSLFFPFTSFSFPAELRRLLFLFHWVDSSWDV
jgi:hypothetical protein